MSAEAKQWVDLFFIVYFLLLGALFAWRTIIWLLRKEQYTSAVKKATLIKAVIHWCAQYLGYPPGHRKLPDLEISYYKHRKMYGFFNFYSKKIRIYPNNHPSVTDIINTTIHEYIHFLEVSNKETRSQYNKYHLETGYEKNPFEVSARKKAADNTPACIEYLFKQGMLKKN